MVKYLAYSINKRGALKIPLHSNFPEVAATPDPA